MTKWNEKGLYSLGIGALFGIDVGAAASSLGASSIGPLVKFSVATPLMFHFVAGFRHFVSISSSLLLRFDLKMCPERLMLNDFRSIGITGPMD